MFAYRVGAVVAAGLLVIGIAGCSGLQRPEGVPTSLPGAIHVAAGDVSNAVENDGQWSFSLVVKDKDAQQAALENLTSSGFKVTGERESDDRRTVALSRAGLRATLVLAEVDGDYVVIYNVVEDK